ncbi:MAG: hypothetical protein IT178_08550, partial [Acidobacteria bacterium]|nr:hypothetical protein [Acidobacteriota bacterium]
MFDVIGLGAHSVDEVYRLPAAPDFHGVNAKLKITSSTVSVGGQVATALATCAAFGWRAAYAGPLGTDERASIIARALDARGVDLTLVTHRPGDSQHAVILIDDTTGERVVLWDRPASLELRDEDLPAEAIRSARVLLVDDVDARAWLAASRIARDAGVAVVTDLDHVTPFTRDIIATASHPILSEHLPHALTGEPDLPRALRLLRSPEQRMIVVTRGRLGAMAIEGDTLIDAPGFEVTVVDSTGSGDVFRGAFIDGLLRGLDTRTL